MVKKILNLVLLMSLFLVDLAQAKLAMLDPVVREQQLALAEDLYAKQDVDGLIKLLKESHLFIQTETALKLGRLGARKALPILRQMDKQNANFACAVSGQFGVAVILIENKTLETQKKALLKVATENPQSKKFAYSVIDRAGRELSRYEGKDILVALENINTYGAQYTVLAHVNASDHPDQAILKCISVLEAHETPQKAQAAEEFLISFGSKAKSAVESLKARMDKKIQSTDPTFTIAKTIQNRCERILKELIKKGE